MILSANRLAQWLVQGDRFSVKLEEFNLVFESKHFTETVPFAIWDGQCQITRGLWWGKVTFIVSPSDQPAKSITVHGLPWRQLSAFAEHLTDAYQAWLSKQQSKFFLVEPVFKELTQELNAFTGYLRDDDLSAWKVKAEKLLAESEVSPQVIAATNPSLYQSFYAWLQQGDAKKAVRNDVWKHEELERWSTWFDGIESSPLNPSQREAVLMDDNHNLLLAGAGSGKTSVIMARAQYLVQSKATQADRILMLAFGKKASEEMKSRLTRAQLGSVDVSTFHSFAMRVVKEVSGNNPVISPLATDEEAKMSWMTLWLAENLSVPATEKRWLKHLEQWPISGLSLDRPLAEQAHEPRLHRGLWRHLDLLNQQKSSLTHFKKAVKGDAKAESELALVWPLVKHYQDTLSDSKSYDFEGLIREATKLLSKKSVTFGATYDHVMVDEYQDISPSRMALLDALCGGKRDRAPALFAVGDDWQAIYQFAGADIRLTTEFLQRYPKGVIGYLDTTYRFNAQIGAVANAFIQANPAQLEKPLNSVKQQKKKAVSLISEDEIQTQLEKVAKEVGDKSASVMFIGRNHANKPESFSTWQNAWPSLQLSYVTAHASKGLEADYCFIVGVNDGVFPAKRRDEGLEAALLSSDDTFEHAEERRLFYVALTRARKACWVCCHPEKPSVFVIELARDYPVVSKLSRKVLAES
ncbi:DNA helicase IV [Enterovibrio sp. ZSDZ35]|uniref:DNA 3'-5' helicase n=1 Tax=Enterovibrio qingdaonensis TaxID=2899818 RepID=A0ABT5QTW8_9GAMM|nr:DNA helicase IV [Enterovibrio sp. ZSDZ35]MDD1783736.1 DNA helicase IV [Enterovibrio sp. ZSDZ35]